MLHLERAVAGDPVPGNLFHAHRAQAVLLVRLHKLQGDGRLADDYVVAVEHGEGLVAGKGAGEADGRARAAHFGLADEEHVGKAGNAQNLFELLCLAALFELCLQLRAAVEMALDQLLAARDDDEYVLNPARGGFLHQKLDGRLVDNGHELLGQGLGQRQHARPVSRRGDDRFFHLHKISTSIM